MKFLFIFQLTILLAVAYSSTTCQNRCGVDDHVSSCQCNSLCSQYGDCCSDYYDLCFTCKDRCGEGYMKSKPCQCNTDCPSYHNCCDDFSDLCGGGGTTVTDDELRALTEELLELDVNNVASYVSYDLQGKTTSSETTDRAPGKFFHPIPPSVFEGTTIKKFMALRNNYEPKTTITENETPEESAEIQEFLTAIMATDVMKHTESFLLQKKLIAGSLKVQLDKIWFDLYSRATRSSSGFEHVMVGEIKSGKVSGFHNWISLYEEELAGKVDYQGYIKTPINLGGKGIILANRFNWDGSPKTFGSLYIGTSPELELALNTICFYARTDQKCPVQMNGHRFNIQTYTIYDGLVGSAYPDI